ncbi:L-lactate dehydrogenase [Gracilibacillus phocaeensis]|uniref:L-lactate dehydrogenase n=1 Tax=Gracilibacillus phocaeensis TaxID=2042304 RepID=UPI001031E5DB|nr:L-lactate dehydrogenase [Gracilibacillus phocaeensis]
MTNIQTKIRKVAIIGAGFVGTSYAYALLNQAIVNELVLIDLDEAKADGEARDLNHGLPFGEPMKVKTGGYEECHNADLVVITAGASQKPGETRLDLVAKNAKIFKGIVEQVMAADFQGIFLVATNPVDILTHVTKEVSGLPKNRVFGSGTSLDSARLQYLLSERLEVDSRDIHAYIIGEHGDSSLPVWSQARVGGVSLQSYTGITDIANDPDMIDRFEGARDAAYHIIDRKGATYYGIALGLLRITKAIFQNENAVLPLSVELDGEYGQQGIYIGVPAILNRQGIREVLELELSETEQQQFAQSAAIIQQMNETARKAIQ